MHTRLIGGALRRSESASRHFVLEVIFLVWYHNIQEETLSPYDINYIYEIVLFMSGVKK